MADQTLTEQGLTPAAEAVILEAVRKTCDAGHGEVTVKVHRGSVKDVVRQETEKISIDAA